ncbi:hypothetical protein BS329_20015 [Amycolatopsis coloradensis]|uniref:Uncharacterized protein n=1 Tax=Amycolatopsis coloradensis TaxID=76021 RepID=A0A1R0KS63_9PSEU|nr:ABC transporter substrate-binding protein [Amycolatopsis coloradensis]OLZ50690.1 hypothetical protein BS329_20015 [Amycolatopsis coloradensis]
MHRTSSSWYRVAEGQDDRIPDAVPVLAEGAPEPVEGDLGHWRVRTRKGVSLSDGAPFGPEDDAATYNAVVDPKFASPIAANFDSPLNGAYGDVPHPSESLATPGPADKLPLGDRPIGTGPYALTELRPDQVALTARDGYWGAGHPVVRRRLRSRAGPHFRQP